MADNVLKLAGEQADEITLVDRDNAYKSTSKKAGKQYNRYRYNGIIFTVDSDSDFTKSFDNSSVSSVKLLQGKRTVVVTDDKGKETEHVVDTLQFDSFVSFDREMNRAKHNMQMDVIKSASTSSVNMTPELMQAILAIPV